MTLRIEDLKPTPGSMKKRRRVGRGPGSGMGKTSTRGYNGQGSRSGRGKTRPGFEGGQTPIFMRSPKRGFKNVAKKEYAIVNLDELEIRFQANEEVTPKTLVEKGVIRKLLDGVKILGNGQISKPLTVKVNVYSGSAKEKIIAAGGTAEVV
jgi:large subunit ribosomal protein L15